MAQRWGESSIYGNGTERFEKEQIWNLGSEKYNHLK